MAKRITGGAGWDYLSDEPLNVIPPVQRRSRKGKTSIVLVSTQPPMPTEEYQKIREEVLKKVLKQEQKEQKEQDQSSHAENPPKPNKQKRGRRPEAQKKKPPRSGTA